MLHSGGQDLLIASEVGKGRLRAGIMFRTYMWIKILIWLLTLHELLSLYASAFRL